MPGSALLGLRYEPPFPYISDYGERGHTVLAGRLRVGRGRHRRGAHRRRLRRGRLPAGARQRAHDPQPGAPRRHLRRARRPVRGHVRARRRPADHRGAARVGPPLPRRRVRALLPALLALRHAAHLLRQDQLVRAHHRGQGRAARRQRDDRPGTPTTSSTGASATGSRTTWTGRCRASATGAPGCRSGAATRATWSAWARARRSRSAAGWCPTISTARTSTRSSCAATCGKDMRRVPDLIDVWWDSGCMPFAQWHAPFENEDKFRERFPADYICEALDQTRGWFYSLLARLDDPVRRELLPDRALPRPDPRRRRARRCRSRRATWWCPGT